MTPEEFKNLKRGDKIILDKECVPHKFDDGTDKELEVAGIDICDDDFGSSILIFTEPYWGQRIKGWIETYNLPQKDYGKWAMPMYLSNCDYLTLVKSIPKQISRGNGEVCKVCKEHNLWADINYPKEDPKIFVCWNCQDSRRWMIPQV